ncbi:hypothetical protein C1H46_008535 [Malus baccata]|uniref:Uncharacterized protein n=1 Tax=Malus baccata TaxID=106549 RepID=A0A540N475_MALBA|nr:hypothetical protein C1H46_008535 [Malus baccata]
MTSTLSSMTTPIITATTLAEMDHRPVNSVDLVGHPVSQAQASSTSTGAGIIDFFGGVTFLEGDDRGDEEHDEQSIVYKLQFGRHGQGHVDLEEGCLKELEDRQDSWVGFCGHFQKSGYVAIMVEKCLSVLQESTSQLPSNTLIKSVDPLKDAGFHIVTEMWTRLSVEGQGHILGGWEMPGGRRWSLIIFLVKEPGYGFNAGSHWPEE